VGLGLDRPTEKSSVFHHGKFGNPTKGPIHTCEYEFESKSVFICLSCQSCSSYEWSVLVDLYESELTRKLIGIFIIIRIIFEIVKVLGIN